MENRMDSVGWWWWWWFRGGWVGREVGVGGEGLSGNEAEVP